MKITLGQIDSTTDVARNLECIREVAAEAARAGSDLVVFPEYAMYEKKVVDGTFAAVAEPLDGPFVTALRGVARERAIAMIAGVVEAPTDPTASRPHNTLVAIGRDGILQARYRNVHLFDSHGFQESAWVAPAPIPEAVTFDLDGVTVGLLTCYDLRFPEQARMLVDAGAQLIVASSSWVPGPLKVDQWRTLLTARAIENLCFTVGVSQAEPVSVGTSMVVDPAGSVLVQLAGGAETATISLDFAAVAFARERDPGLGRRRFNVTAAT